MRNFGAIADKSNVNDLFRFEKDVKVHSQAIGIGQRGVSDGYQTQIGLMPVQNHPMIQISDSFYDMSFCF